MASCARIRTVAHRPVLPQLMRTRRVRGLKLVTWELEYHLFQKVFELELSCCLLAHQEELKRCLP